MRRRIAIHSFRGGTGKSTLVANLSIALAKMGFSIGTIDLDLAAPGLHHCFGIEESEIKHTLNEFLWGSCSLSDVIIDLTDRLNLEKGKLYFIPASASPQDILKVLKEGYEVALFSEAMFRLRSELGLDSIIIDTHPGLSEDTLLAIAACDTSILLTRVDRQDFEGTAITLEITKRFGRESFLIVTMAPPRISPEIIKAEVERVFGRPVLGVVPFNEDVLEASRTRELFALTRPDHSFSKVIYNIANQIVGL